MNERNWKLEIGNWKLLERGFSSLTILLFTLLPFHAFLVTVWKYKLDLPGPINAWKEIIIIVLIVLTLIDFVINKKKKGSFIASEDVLIETKQFRAEEKKSSLGIRNWELDILDFAVFAFFAIGLLSSILQFLKLGNDSFARIVYGFKYDFLMLAVFLLFRHSSLVTEQLLGKVIKVITISGMTIVVFAILQTTILPRNFLTLFGYTPAFGTWDPNGPLATYQALSANHPDIVRAMGTFAGPNQFAMYCLILIGLFLTKLSPLHWGRNTEIEARSEKPNLLATCYLLLATLSVFALLLSFSRSAYIGLIIATIFLFFFHSNIPSSIKNLKLKIKNSRSLLAILVIILIILPCTLYLLPTTFLDSVFVRESSSQGHWERSLDGISRMFDKPLLGAGIGEAGPASARADSRGLGFMPENWYLQVGIQYGLPSLIVWITILYLMTKTLLQKIRNPAPDFTLCTLHFALLFSLIAISTACLFLHAWEDSAVAITWWGLAGIVLQKTRRDAPSAS